MNYLDAIVSCPNGFAAVLTEYHNKGYTEFLHYENGVPTMLSSRLNRFYPDVPNFNTPSLAYLRGSVADMTRLASVNWDNAIIFLVVSPNDIYADIEADPVAFAVYRTYVDWLPFLDAEGNETNVDTGIANPRYGTIKPIGVWA